MQTDSVDQMSGQWTRQHPELDTAGLNVVVRILTLNKPLRRQATEALATLGLELWGYDVLAALRRQGSPCQLPVSALARAVSLSFGAITSRIDMLETKGYVTRQPDPGDGCGVIVRLTRRGRYAIGRAIAGRLAAADDSVRGLTKTARETLASLLRKVALSSEPDTWQQKRLVWSAGRIRPQNRRRSKTSRWDRACRRLVYCDS